MKGLFKIIGMRKVLSELKALEPKIAKKILRKSMREALKPVAQAVKANAPRKTGALRQSVKVRAIKRSRNNIGVMVSISKGHFKGDQWYGSVQEFGSKVRNIPRKDYMKRAFDSTATATRDRAIALIRAGIQSTKVT